MDKKQKVLNWFIESVNIEEPIIIFGSSAMYLHKITQEFNDVDIALTKVGLQKLYKKLKQKDNIIIDWKEEKVSWVKMWNININNFWESIKIRFIISWVDFEWFVEKNEKNWVFWKYFKDLNKFTNPVWNTNIHVLKLEYLKDSYREILKKEMDSFNKNVEANNKEFKLDYNTNIKQLNDFLEKNGEVFDKKIMKIFDRKDKINKLNNLHIN